MIGAGITLVLSGGGARAAAHVGAARAIEEAGGLPLRYVATSMVEELVPARRFSDLAVPITVTAVDLDTGELLLFGEGGVDAPLVDVLCASCALPVYFPAVRVGGRRCGDGGLRCPVPLEVAAGLAQETVVAVDVGPGFDAADAATSPAAPAVVRAHGDAVGALMASATAAQLALWRAAPSRPRLVYVRPRTERGATFRVDRVRQYADEGHRATREALATAARP